MQDTRTQMRREVSGWGNFPAFGIVGIGLVASIFIENFGAPETVKNIP